jgi:hypothetical protein
MAAHDFRHLRTRLDVTLFDAKSYDMESGSESDASGGRAREEMNGESEANSRRDPLTRGETSWQSG